MQDIIDQLLSYMRGIWRHRWYALVVAWVVSIGGWIVVYQLPDQYEASAQVYVDTQSVLRPLLQGLAVNVNDPNAQVALMTRTLVSRPNIEKVARMTDLDLQAKNTADMEKLLNRLEKDIELRGAGRENLYTIAYVNDNPEMAKKVVQSLLTIFVENTLGGTRQDSSTAQRFLDRQIADYEARLLAAEKRLKEFKRVNIDVMPASGQSYYQNMQRMAEELEAEKLALRQAESRRDALQGQIVGEEPTFGFDPEPFVTEQKIAPTINLPVQVRIQNLQQELDLLLLKYTDKHPDVIAAREMISLLEKKYDEQLNQLATARASSGAAGGVPSALGSGNTLDTNPVYQQLRIALSTEEANIAAIQARVADYEQRLEELKNKVDTVPEIEAQLTALNRDYDVTKANYEELLSRRESAHISQQAEQTTDDIRFKVIEPPRVPFKPSGPNRPLLASGVMVASMGAGLALAFLLAQIRPTFDTRRSLTQITGLPVLGSVGMILSGAEVRSRRFWLVVYVLLFAGLLMVFGLLLALELTGGLRIPYFISSMLK